MYLLESIRILNGRIYNLAYHQARLNQTQKSLFGLTAHPQLKKAISIPKKFRRGEFKCRIVYSTDIQSIEFIPYISKKINSLKLVHANFSYTHKFKDRAALNKAFAKRGNHDDIIIVKNGLITDSYYANLAFKKDGKWYTPKDCLLKGTQREKLLKAKRIQEQKIHFEEIHMFSHVCLFNAMIHFKQNTLSTKQIIV